MGFSNRRRVKVQEFQLSQHHHKELKGTNLTVGLIKRLVTILGQCCTFVGV